ncbi:Crp/Fnr family transcriptional regulator [Flavobacterium sp. Root420]|uniref:Crp/Fnr family transcriptional regulator n=1 Tax=Flavobacterium sp. Root420 TaxID=1736533 RepID=UPI000700A156|nr:Crp/Fnr family transcriptional regulator [Flavobacterium sp. Root420]KQW99411.1 cyclic nucleotide-binding protein [Flavobacterium sp. Root420]
MYKPALRLDIEDKINLTDYEWKCIAEKGEIIKLKKNELLQVQGSKCSHSLFILKGAFKTYILSEKGKEVIIFFSFENEWICDHESFYYQKLNTYNVKAIEESEIVIFNEVNKMLLLELVPKLVEFHIIMIEKVNFALQQRLLDVLTKTSKQRYLEFIERYQHKMKVISSRNLSSYLGVSHEFLSKIKKESTQ